MSKIATIPSHAEEYKYWMTLARQAHRRAVFAAALKPDVSENCQRARRACIEKALAHARSQQHCMLAWVNNEPIRARAR